MAVSTPARQNPTTVYGLDRDTWRRFRAWCTWHDLETGEAATQALEQYMAQRPMQPASPDPQEND